MNKYNLISAIALGEGNPVFIVGSRTGKDGIHGATFASEELSEKTESKRSNVQVGDPFYEKLLLEASLELFETGAVIAAQDMGAAGLTSSTTEIAIKGNYGIEIDLSAVPLREEGMEPWEILLSESQERMLFVLDYDTLTDRGKENIFKFINEIFKESLSGNIRNAYRFRNYYYVFCSYCCGCRERRRASNGKK